MNRALFTARIEQQIEVSRDLLVHKGTRYASSDDSLHNFRVASDLLHQPMQVSLAGMMSKHTVKLYDMLMATDDIFTWEDWQEVITDHINYLLILSAIIADDLGIVKELAQSGFSMEEIAMIDRWHARQMQTDASVSYSEEQKDA